MIDWLVVAYCAYSSSVASIGAQLHQPIYRRPKCALKLREPRADGAMGMHAYLFKKLKTLLIVEKKRGQPARAAIAGVDQCRDLVFEVEVDNLAADINDVKGAPASLLGKRLGDRTRGVRDLDSGHVWKIQMTRSGTNLVG